MGYMQACICCIGLCFTEALKRSVNTQCKPLQHLGLGDKKYEIFVRSAVLFIPICSTCTFAKLIVGVVRSAGVTPVVELLQGLLLPAGKFGGVSVFLAVLVSVIH